MTLSALTRSWPTLAAWGAGLIHLGLGAGMITKGSDVAVRAVGALLVTVGAAALVWGVAALARDRLTAPRIGMAIAVLGPVTVALALAVDPFRVSVHAAAVSILLFFACGVAAGFTARRRARSGRSDVVVSGAATAAAEKPTAVVPGVASPEARPVPRTSIVGLLVGAAIVAGLVTPALGSTEAGQAAPSHSDHPLFIDHGH